MKKQYIDIEVMFPLAFTRTFSRVGKYGTRVVPYRKLAFKIAFVITFVC